MRRTRLFGLVVVLTASPVLAQTPIALTPLAAPVNGTRAVVDWKGPSGEAPDGVVAQGPAVRVTASTDRTVHKPHHKLAGSFTVSAVFQRASAASTAPYGLTLGSSEGVPLVVAFLVRPDGAFSIQRVTDAGLRGRWSSGSPLLESTSEAMAQRLEVRVAEGSATFLVNGEVVASVSINPGEFDGSPGVHVGASGDVLVSAFTVEGARTLFMK